MQTTLEQIKIRHALLSPILAEKQYRIYLASEAKALSWGGVSNRRWAAVETVGYALDGQGCEQYYRPTLQYPEQSLGKFLGASGGVKIYS